MKNADKLALLAILRWLNYCLSVREGAGQLGRGLVDQRARMFRDSSSCRDGHWAGPSGRGMTSEGELNEWDTNVNIIVNVAMIDDCIVLLILCTFYTL
jgi:hypothetical protein